LNQITVTNARPLLALHQLRGSGAQSGVDLSAIYCTPQSNGVLWFGTEGHYAGIVLDRAGLALSAAGVQLPPGLNPDESLTIVDNLFLQGANCLEGQIIPHPEFMWRKLVPQFGNVMLSPATLAHTHVLKAVEFFKGLGSAPDSFLTIFTEGQGKPAVIVASDLPDAFFLVMPARTENVAPSNWSELLE